MLAKEDLQPNLLVQEGQTLYKVSMLYEHNFTAQVVYPLPPRTTVRTLSYDRFYFKPTNRMIARYEAAWGFAPGSTP